MHIYFKSFKINNFNIKHLGGTEGTGVLIGKKKSYDVALSPSFPGGGTVRFVFEVTKESV